MQIAKYSEKRQVFNAGDILKHIILCGILKFIACMKRYADTQNDACIAFLEGIDMDL